MSLLSLNHNPREEVVFRGVMLPLLRSGGCSPLGATVVSLVVFALAHAHHYYLIVRRMPRSKAIIAVAGQLVMTSVFGALAAYMFLRTGHLLAPTVSHMFCNAVGGPGTGWLDPEDPAYPRRKVIAACYLVR